MDADQAFVGMLLFFLTIGKTLYAFVCYRDHNKHKTQRRGKLYGISLISEKKTLFS